MPLPSGLECWLAWFCVGNHNCREFISLGILSCPKHIALPQYSLPLDLTIHPLLLLQCSLSLGSKKKGQTSKRWAISLLLCLCVCVCVYLDWYRRCWHIWGSLPTSGKGILAILQGMIPTQVIFSLWQVDTNTNTTSYVRKLWRKAHADCKDARKLYSKWRAMDA